ncbi:MAG: DUF1127 domain-containing protein [Rhodospirillales bacterium]|nr:DUF1127 domain-containing protein [Alphaproteobacteria bacterium]MBL6947150.1 DUF1127 domain-containing protein [Rhodospirillales bacterium]
MSGNVYELRSKITRSDIDAGVRRGRELRSRYIANLISGGLKAIITAVAAWSRRLNQARHLADLPDYLLKDMGIERHQIERMVSGSLRRDPLSLSPTGNPSSSPAFWRGREQTAETSTVTKRAA